MTQYLVTLTDQGMDEIPSVAHPDSIIIRYMSLPKFLSLLINRSLWFCRADQFSDEYEGFAVINTKDSDTYKTADYFRKLSYMNCWNRFRRESFHMWHIYGGPDKYGVGVVSTVKAVIDNIEDEYIRSRTKAYEIKYVQHDKIYDGINGLVVNTRKKEWYDYEEEIRFIDYQGIELDDPGQSVSINIKPMITKIILSPYVEDWFLFIFQDLLEKYGLDRSLVVRSELRDTMLKK